MSRNEPDWAGVGRWRGDIADREGRKAAVLPELQVAQVAEGAQVQEMSWKWQAIGIGTGL